MINEQGMISQPDPHYMGMDKFIIFFGVAEDRDDPLKIGRVRIRIFGVHPDDPDLMPTDDLPWAYPIFPVSAAQIAGIGHGSIGVLPGSQVVGFFADGADRQIPMFFGVTSGGLGRWAVGAGGGTPDTSGDGGAYNPESLPGTHAVQASAATIQKGAQMAKNILAAFPKLKPHHASAIVGNLICEGGMRIPAIREGTIRKPVTDPWDESQYGAGHGYGWAQWTNTAPNKGRFTNFMKFCRSQSGDNYREYAKSEEANRLFFLYEMQHDYSKYRKNLESNSVVTINNKKFTAYNGTYDLSKVEDATTYWMATYEVPAPKYSHSSERITNAKAVWNILQSGGNNGGSGGSIRGQGAPAK